MDALREIEATIPELDCGGSEQRLLKQIQSYLEDRGNTG